MADPQAIWQPSAHFPSNLTAADVQFIGIRADAMSTPTLSNGLPEHCNVGWDASLTGDGRHEVLTSFDATFYLKNLHGNAAYDLAAR
jgi:hypothetical protein